MDAPTLPPGQATSLLRRFDDLSRALAALLDEALVAAPAGEFLDALGLETLERHLPAEVRLRLLQRALTEGRAGRPFDDAALLAAAPPAVLAAHLPGATLRSALARLEPVAPGLVEGAVGALATGGLVGAVAAVPGAAESASEVDPEPLGDDDELTVALDASSSQSLLDQLPPELLGR